MNNSNVKLANTPAFPIAIAAGESIAYLGITRWEYYAAHAPVEIPEWFNRDVKKLRRPIPEYLLPGSSAAEYHEQKTKADSGLEERFFQWREYYASKMCQLC